MIGRLLTTPIAQQFLELQTPQDLAQLLGVRYDRLIWHISRTDAAHRYKQFDVAKRDGTPRLIHSPSGPLKRIQRRLTNILTEVYRPPRSVHGFLPHRGILSNAKLHEHKQFVLTLDLSNFFPSINWGRVSGLFIHKQYGLPAPVAYTIATIACHDNELPQGAPSSPIISNMICRGMDFYLESLAREHHCAYTRYADDLIFSTRSLYFPPQLASIALIGGNPSVQLGDELAAVISGAGFAVNPNKTKLRTRTQQQLVTGLVVNDGVNVQRRFVKHIRLMLYSWERFGLAEAQEHYRAHVAVKHRLPTKSPPPYRAILGGKLSFLAAIRGLDDPVVRNLRHRFNFLHQMSESD